MGGIIIIKKSKEMPLFLKEWYNLSLFHPELLFDTYGADLNRLPNSFNEHRHDQAIITPLIFHYKEKDSIAILPETSESQKGKASIVATRTHVWTWNIIDKLLFHSKKFCKRIKP